MPSIWNTSYTPQVIVAPTLTQAQYDELMPSGVPTEVGRTVVDNQLASAVAQANQTNLERVRDYRGGLNTDGSPFWGAFPWWASGYTKGMTPDGTQALPGCTLANKPVPKAICILDLSGSTPSVKDGDEYVCPEMAVPNLPPAPVAPSSGTDGFGRTSGPSNDVVLADILAKIDRIIAQLKTP